MDQVIGLGTIYLQLFPKSQTTSPLCSTPPISNFTNMVVVQKEVNILRPSVEAKSGLTTKIHAVVDGLGNPVRIKLTCGNVCIGTEF